MDSQEVAGQRQGRRFGGRSLNSREGIKWSWERRVARKGPSDRETADQRKGAPYDRKYINQWEREGAEQPKWCQMNERRLERKALIRKARNERKLSGPIGELCRILSASANDISVAISSPPSYLQPPRHANILWKLIWVSI